MRFLPGRWWSKSLVHGRAELFPTLVATKDFCRRNLMPYKDADVQRAYKKEWARMDRAGESGTPGGTLAMPFRLRTARDILSLLEEQVELVKQDSESGTLEKARTVGYLAAIALKAVEVADVAGRVDVLETVLKGRSPA
jgi:hypothetical protein